MLNQPNPSAYAAAPNQTADYTTYRSEPFEPAHIGALDVTAFIVAAAMILGPLAMAWRSTMMLPVI